MSEIAPQPFKPSGQPGEKLVPLSNRKVAQRLDNTAQLNNIISGIRQSGDNDKADTLQQIWFDTPTSSSQETQTGVQHQALNAPSSPQSSVPDSQNYPAGQGRQVLDNLSNVIADLRQKGKHEIADRLEQQMKGE